MSVPDPGADTPNAVQPAATSRSRLAGLAPVLLGIAVVAAIALFQAPSRQATDEAATQLAIEGSIAVRQAYWATRRAPMDGVFENVAATRALSSLERLAKAENSAQEWRILAISRYILKAGRWQDALLALRHARPRRPALEVERELAIWRIAFAPDMARDSSAAFKQPRPEAEPCFHEAERFIGSLNLGWFRHPALAALYANHGMPEAARRHEASALRFSDRVTIAAVLLALVALGGLGVWCTLILGWLILGRTALLGHVASFKVLSRDQARSLTLATAAFFAGLVILRLAASALPRSFTAYLDADEAAASRALLSAVLGILSLLPPMAVLFYTGFIKGPGLASVGLVRWKPIRDPAAAAVAYAAAVPVLAVTLIISSLIFRETASPMNPAIEEFVSGGSMASRALMLLAGVVVAPFVEELVFRGMLLRSMQPYAGTAGSIILSSAVFAILHPQLPMGFLSIFGLGVFFALLYRLTGSLWPSIIAHAINNGVIFAYLALVLAD
jgi:membrane protease YdiL (CAAX protease family)